MNLQCLGLLTIVFVNASIVMSTNPVHITLTMDEPKIDLDTKVYRERIVGNQMFKQVPVSDAFFNSDYSYNGYFRHQNQYQLMRNNNRATLFFSKTDRGNMVHPSKYYRVYNKHLESVTPYASFIPINANGEENHVHFRKPNLYRVYK